MHMKLFYVFVLIVYPQIHPCTLFSCTVSFLYGKMIPTQSTNHVLHCLETADAAINFDRYRLLYGMHYACCWQKIAF